MDLLDGQQVSPEQELSETIPPTDGDYYPNI
jgi:hypothetical protein